LKAPPVLRLSFFTLVLHLTPACFAMPAVHMVVTDAQDNRPIAGANVLFTARAREGTLSGHGGRVATLFLAEAVSDHNGNISFGEQKAALPPFLFNTNYDPPWLLVFKPGYAIQVIRNELRAPNDPRLVTAWDHEGEVIRMQRVTTEKERGDAIYWAQSDVSDIYWAAKTCSWKSIPLILVALEKEASEEAKRHGSGRPGPVTQLIRDRTVQDEGGCGSPLAFFQRYFGAAWTAAPREPAAMPIVISSPPAMAMRPAVAASEGR